MNSNDNQPTPPINPNPIAATLSEPKPETKALEEAFREADQMRDGASSDEEIARELAHELFLDEEEQDAAIPAILTAIRKSKSPGDKFKAFVHSYLTQHGVPEGDPTNQHQIEGCRIGARLDLLLARVPSLSEPKESMSLRMHQEAWCELARLLGIKCWPMQAPRFVYEKVAAMLAEPKESEEEKP